MIQTWTMGCRYVDEENDAVKTDYHINLEDVSARWFIFDQLADSCFCNFCWLYWFVLPRWKLIRDDGEWHSFRDWYGDLGQFLYLYITFPIVNWVYEYRDGRSEEMEIPISTEMATKLNPEWVQENKELWTDDYWEE